MHVHIDHEFIERNPWLGMLIGLVGAVLFGFFSYTSIVEYWKFSVQQFPIELEISNIKAEDSQRKWVKINNGIVNCEFRYQTERGVPEKWLFGKIDETFMIMTVPDQSKFIILMSSGDYKCNNDITNSFIGVLTDQDDNYYGYNIPDALKTAISNKPFYVLHLGEGLNRSKENVVLSLLIFLATSLFTLYMGYLQIKKIGSK